MREPLRRIFDLAVAGAGLVAIVMAARNAPTRWNKSALVNVLLWVVSAVVIWAALLTGTAAMLAPLALHGIPVLIKDNIATADRMETTAGSLALLGVRPPRDSFVARKLREAGAVVEQIGSLEVLVNNAGMDEFGFFTETDPQMWERVLAVNLKGVLACTHAALPAMQRSGYGRIVNIASEAGRVGSKGSAVYSARCRTWSARYRSGRSTSTGWPTSSSRA